MTPSKLSIQLGLYEARVLQGWGWSRFTLIPTASTQRGHHLDFEALQVASYFPIEICLYMTFPPARYT